MMRPQTFHFTRVLHIILLALTLLATNARAQQNQSAPETQEQVEDVVRVNTELVQTDVMVFEKTGNFVDKLQREQFILRVDGRPQPVTFFERVTAGSVNEEAQLAAARGTSRASSNNGNAASPVPLDRGRLIYFFIDDLHLSPSSVPRTRATLLRFIESEMGQNDQAAIISATGQVGFLQQLTDNKTVLRAAVSRLLPRINKIDDMDHPPMSEYQALNIAQRDQDVTGYFVERLLQDNPMLGPETATEMVRNRANIMLQQAALYTKATLSTLNNILRSTAPLPGRKLLFLFSDGFFLDDKSSSVSSELHRLTDAAARASIVIYSLDARGLSTGQPDASSAGGFDPSGRLARSNSSEISASQDALNALAVDTGGRALRNSNDLAMGVKKALKETSVYYLLAWRPDEMERTKGGKFRRIEVSISGRPDLIVRVRRGFFEPDNNSTNVANTARPSKEKSSAPNKTPDYELREALNARIPRSALPTMLSANYLDTPNVGTILHAAIQIQPAANGFAGAQNKRTAEIDLAGVVFNDKGKPADSFRDHVNVTLTGTSTDEFPRTPIFYNYQTRLAAGLYQVRVASRDLKTGMTGSATQWIEIPNLTQQRLSLSSLFVGERISDPAGAAASEPDITKQVQLNVDHRFARSSHMRFLTFIYNLTRNAPTGAAPDAAIQVQIFRDDQPVVTTPLRKIDTTNTPDLARIPYAAEISLGTLPAGRYALRVTAIDRLAKTSASQQTNFEID
jgi:VWFA-related protein